MSTPATATTCHGSTLSPDSFRPCRSRTPCRRPAGSSRGRRLWSTPRCRVHPPGDPPPQSPGPATNGKQQLQHDVEQSCRPADLQLRRWCPSAARPATASVRPRRCWTADALTMRRRHIAARDRGERDRRLRQSMEPDTETAPGVQASVQQPTAPIRGRPARAAGKPRTWRPTPAGAAAIASRPCQACCGDSRAP